MNYQYTVLTWGKFTVALLPQSQTRVCKTTNLTHQIWWSRNQNWTFSSPFS